MKSKSNKIIIVFGVLFSIVILIASYIHYQGSINMLILTSKNSYAEKYARKHFLEVENVSTSEQDKYALALEEFEYQEKNGNLIITEYKGKSSRLIIPTTINGKRVVEISPDILENKDIKTLVISKNINNLDKGKFKDINIECFKNSYCEELKETEGLTVKILNDSEFINFNNINKLFAYELKNNEIELIRYDGNSNIAIIPSKINGYSVTKISFDSKNIIGIYIPESIKSIGNNFISTYLYRTYIIVTITTFTALCIFIIIELLNRSKNIEEKSNNTIVSIISIIYLFVIGYFTYTLDNVYIGYKLYFIRTLITTFVYIFISITLLKALKISSTYQNKIKSKETFINEMLLLLEDVDESDKYNLKELIRFSDPMSTKEVEELEVKIKELVKNINSGNVHEIEKLIKKRNIMIKQNKNNI